MSAFKSWLTQALDLGQEPDLDDAFEAGRRSVLGHREHTSVGIIFSRLDREVIDHKIRLAGALALLRDQGVISSAKMLQLSGMTNSEIGKALSALSAEVE